MFRRCFLTAAAAVAIALVAPSISKAQFTVTVAGAANPSSVGSPSQILGSQFSGTINAAGTFTLAPFPLTANVINLGSISGSGANPFQTVTLPGLQPNPGSLNTAVGLADLVNTIPYVAGTTAGVYTSGTFSQSLSPSTGTVLTSTSNIIFNDTNAVETVTITVLGTFSGPGSGGTYQVNDSLSENGFLNYTAPGGTPSDAGGVDVFTMTGSSPSAGVFSPSFTVDGNSNGNGNTNNNSFSFSSGIPYTLQEQVTLTIAAGDYVQFNAKMTDFIVSAPAPSGLIMGLAGLPFLGFGYLRRRMERLTPKVA